MGTEDVARQLPRPSSVAAADLLLELAGLFLAASAAAGFGITYLSGVAFNLEERVVFGSVLGAMTVALMTFVPALLVRDVTLLTVLLGLAVALATGAVGLWFGLSVLGRDWRNARDRCLAPLRTPGHPWPLVAAVVACGARSEEHTSELQSPCNLVCRLLLEKKKKVHGHAGANQFDKLLFRVLHSRLHIATIHFGRHHLTLSIIGGQALTADPPSSSDIRSLA